MKAFASLFLLGALALEVSAQTIASFHFYRLGAIEIELFDDKPVTVSNFLKYAASGRYQDQLIHRWVPGFVIQGGGFSKEPDGSDCFIDPVPVFGMIPNESKVGAFRSNAYGTIAMARQGTNVNSATSQWFINLADNGGSPPNGLDHFAEGYTVFGRVISGTNLVNLFVPPPPENDIHIIQTFAGPTAVLTNAANATCNDLITVSLSFRRDMNLQATRNIRGARQIRWDSVAGVTNSVDFSLNLTNWVTFTNVIGTGSPMQFTDSSSDAQRFYRVQLLY